MNIILGGTGQVGSVVAQTLLDGGRPVTILTRDPAKAGDWERKGARVAVVAIEDTERLRAVFRQGDRAYLINPAANPASDSAREERRTVQLILKALEESGLQNVVVQSTYGAQPGDRLGDLGVLYELEQGCRATGIPTRILRAAYFMSNWNFSLETARQEGKVYTLYPPDFRLPMVAPGDLGRAGAQLLSEPDGGVRPVFAEGPETYSAADVAVVLTGLLQRPVEAVEIPERGWMDWLRGAGFSEKSAESMAAMTKVTREEAYEKPSEPVRGQTTLREYLSGRVTGR
ncbi:NmrA family NAD(P)-binding protein [Larkinella soli]|uniref:NmrA family NAD(P)-binding protein n=1 Tax=Larkinella soli TaxID=1770527 RepID=UPI000FFB8E3E|nr:NAD(P)H-binding protein [Larkinella soli]